ncbi:WD40-repeat-containing domain protein [Gilbertella persicaria]|uniref:U3 small nucleolar RNA-associated protein 13 n=1 Tax=Rhizopus stolonifer TaxID=4846 RepID=A0A367KLE1_RHIST|nr:WD40-repeat-containing domain protein [Gilbertella persicaria]KAI8072212.1 WD40-repeat-containing domain protein [Gilbertella persicaria]RCI03064.1 U3 small nucleolar RNA-associated protein 13 [Rhizopus stolonifer]
MTEDSSKLLLKTSFKSIKTIESIYTGGKVVITKDAKYLISTLNEDIIVTELDTGKQVFELEGDTEIITTMAVKPDSKHLVSASRSLFLRVWDLEKGESIRTLKAHEAPIIVMDIDPTSTLVATGSADATIKVWNIDKGFCTHNLKGHGGVISAVKFHNYQGKWYLASGADDCQIRIWDLQSRSCIAVLQSHVSVIRGLDFSADGKYLISGSRDKVVNVWDWQAKTLRATYPIFETIETVGFLEKNVKLAAKFGKNWQDADIFYTAGDSGLIKLWDLKSGKLIKAQEPEKNSKHTISDVVYIEKTQTLAAVTNDQNILMYSLENKLERVKQIVGYNDEVVDVVYLGENDTHLAAATNSAQLRVYNVETQDCDLLYGHDDMILSIDRSKDGLLIATASKDKTARLWKIDMANPDKSMRFQAAGLCVGHTESVGAVALSRKSNSFMITGSQDRTIKYWNLRDFDLEDLDEDYRPKSLYTHQAHEKDINTICVAPNDKFFATGSQDKTAKLWNVDTGELIGTMKGHKRGVWSAQFSPVDQVLATSSGDKTVKIWSLKDFTCLKTFEGHTNSVLRVNFLSAGMQLVSAGSDGLVKVWTIKTNECASTLDNHTQKVWALSVRKDEKFIVSAGADSVINFWEDVTLQEQEEDLKEKEQLIIKEQELQNFMRKKDYLNAILLALSLEQPFRLLGLFREVYESRPEGDKSITGSENIDIILAELSLENTGKLLTYARDWNTNAKHSDIAQVVIYAILSSRTSEELVEIPTAKELIDGLLPYTDRHYQRIDDLITQSFIIDYTLQAQK